MSTKAVSSIEVRDKFAQLFKAQAGFEPDDIIWACYNQMDKFLYLEMDNIELFVKSLKAPEQRGVDDTK